MNISRVVAFVLSALVFASCADDNPWSQDRRLVSELSDSQRDEFCEFHAQEKASCDSERSLRKECGFQMETLASRGCAVAAEVSDCWTSTDGCDVLECGYGCESDCTSKTLEECPETPGCSIRPGMIETENQCFEQVEAHCQNNWSNCNNAGQYAQSPDGTCHIFSATCPLPRDWSSFPSGGPCKELAYLESCE